MHFLFTVMLILASQRIETLFFNVDYPVDYPSKRGAKPSLVEWLILAWVSGKYEIITFLKHKEFLFTLR